VGLTFFKACSSILTFQPILSVDHQNYSAPVSQSVFLKEVFYLWETVGKDENRDKKENTRALSTRVFFNQRGNYFNCLLEYPRTFRATIKC